MNIRPLDWKPMGSHLHKAEAMGVVYTIAGSPLQYTAQARGETLYRGDDIEAAKAVAQARHVEWVNELIDMAADRNARFDDAGNLDECVANDVSTFHLKQMGWGHWNLNVEHCDGAQTVIDLTVRRPRRTRIDAMIMTDEE